MSYEGRVPSQARCPRKNYGHRKDQSGVSQGKVDSYVATFDELEDAPPRQQLTLSKQLIGQAMPPRLGRPPDTDEEKHLVLRALVYLKAANLTNLACAKELDVSERTVATYLKDEAYQELQQELFSGSRAAGYTSIGAMISIAMNKMLLLTEATSEFVQFKSAEYILKMAGYELPPEGRVAESRDEGIRFLDAIRAEATARTMNVNVNFSTGSRNAPHPGGDTPVAASPGVVEQVIDALPSPTILPGDSLLAGGIPEELQQYYQPVKPGGMLPWESETPTGPVQ